MRVESQSAHKHESAARLQQPIRISQGFLGEIASTHNARHPSTRETSRSLCCTFHQLGAVLELSNQRNDKLQHSSLVVIVQPSQEPKEFCDETLALGFTERRHDDANQRIRANHEPKARNV